MKSFIVLSVIVLHNFNREQVLSHSLAFSNFLLNYFACHGLKRNSAIYQIYGLDDVMCKQKKSPIFDI